MLECLLVVIDQGGSIRASPHRSSSMACRISALFFCLRREKHLQSQSRSAESESSSRRRRRRVFSEAPLLPAVVHQHVADAAADAVFGLSHLLQDQHPLGLLRPLLLVDPLLQTLLLLDAVRGKRSLYSEAV